MAYRKSFHKLSAIVVLPSSGAEVSFRHVVKPNIYITARALFLQQKEPYSHARPFL